MDMAIGIRLKRAPRKYDLAASKFFGAPTIPREWDNSFYDEELFLCQIRLSDIASLDTDGRLPHEGYLYIFLDTSEGEYNLSLDVRYYAGEPTLAIDDFNEGVEGYEKFTRAYLVEFYPVADDEACTRLLGIPSDWNYAEEPPRLLLQYDPLDNETGFLSHIDGFLYFAFGEDECDLSKVRVIEEYS